MDISQSATRFFNIRTEQVDGFTKLDSLFLSGCDNRFDDVKRFSIGDSFESSGKVSKQLFIASQQTGFGERGKNVSIFERHTAGVAGSPKAVAQLESRVGYVLRDSARKFNNVIR